LFSMPYGQDLSAQGLRKHSEPHPKGATPASPPCQALQHPRMQAARRRYFPRHRQTAFFGNWSGSLPCSSCQRRDLFTILWLALISSRVCSLRSRLRYRVLRMSAGVERRVARYEDVIQEAGWSSAPDLFRPGWLLTPCQPYTKARRRNRRDVSL
jgi:hypothetical protein